VGPRAGLDVLEERDLTRDRIRTPDRQVRGLGSIPTAAYDDDDDNAVLCLFACSFNNLVAIYVKKYEPTKPRQKTKENKHYS
jgi:hypothetical protein